MSIRRKIWVKRATGASVVAVSVCSLALVTQIDRWIPAPEAAPVLSTQLEASASSVTLACPSGVLDPFNIRTREATGSLWTSESPATLTSTKTRATDAAEQFLTVESQSGETLRVPSGVVIAGQGGGELVGLSMTGCAAASTDQWIAAGKTTVGEDALLMLSNPAPTATVVSISGYGATGLLDETPQQVTVPAGKSLVVLPAGWFPDQERLALHISADGSGVAAWMQSSGMSGEIPLGQSWIPSTRPQRTHVIAGIIPSAESSVRVAVPGEESAHVELSVVTAQGTTPIAGGSIDVDGSSVLDIPLGGIATGEEPVALLVHSDRPVVAQARMNSAGAAWNGGTNRWGLRTLLPAASAVTHVDIPGRRELEERVKAQLSTTPIRPTALATSSGVSDIRTQLMLIADGVGSGNDDERSSSESGQSTRIDEQQSSADPVSAPLGGVDVRIGSETLTVNPQSLRIVDVPEVASTVESNSPIRVVVLVTAQTPAGQVHALWSGGILGVSTERAEVFASN